MSVTFSHPDRLLQQSDYAPVATASGSRIVLLVGQTTVTEATSERELIRSDLGVALTELLDIDAIVSETTPLEITGWTCGAESVTLPDKRLQATRRRNCPPPAK